MLPLEAPRLVLRRFATSDAPVFAAYRADPSVARYQGWESCTLAEAVAFIRRQRRQASGAPGRWTQIALALRVSDILIGDLGLHLHADDPRQATIGVTLVPAYQGRGYAAEALTTLLDHLFRQMDLHRVTADVDPRNRSSWTLLERLGMRREGHRVRSVWFKGQWADEYLYAVLREEWLARQPRIDTELAHQTLLRGTGGGAPARKGLSNRSGSRSSGGTGGKAPVRRGLGNRTGSPIEKEETWHLLT